MTAISVIVVNYRAAGLAMKAVQSVLDRAHSGHQVDVHLVDNASPGVDADLLAAACAQPGWAGRVVFYPETVNHGFGKGNNLVLERLATQSSPPDYVFLLNPDARLKNEAIAVLAEFLEACPEIAVAGAQIEKPDTIPVTAAFRFPGLISTFAGALAFGPVSRLTRRWQVALPPEAVTGRVDWVAGASVMFRFAPLRAVGYFDPDYFLYYEEVDLMRRLNLAGWRTWYVAEAKVIHAEGASTGVKSGEVTRRRRPAYWYESWHFYFLKNHGRYRATLACLAWIFGAGLNHFMARLRGKVPAVPLHFFRDIWAMVGRPILGLEARPYD